MKIAVPKERATGERRVSLVPDIVAKFVKNGITVAVEHDAGAAAGFVDAAYEKAGATIVADPKALVGDADVIARVGRPTDDELEGLKRGAIVVGFLSPLGDPRSVER
jgi:H+-translocating NAD(P) transhydrogenase subunit alpha